MTFALPKLSASILIHLLMLLVGIQIGIYYESHFQDFYQQHGINYVNIFVNRSVKPTQSRTFVDISLKYRTDKVTQHQYGWIYEKYLSNLIGTRISLLEIGLGCSMSYPAGASAHLWREYFGNLAEIHFLEVDRRCGENWFQAYGRKLNVTIHYGDQADPQVLQNLSSSTPYFDVIIDDGGHSMKQQITSFTYLLPRLKSGGIYAIEDLFTSYEPSFGGGYLLNTTTIEMIKSLVDGIQRSSPSFKSSVSQRIVSFELTNEICIFTAK